MCCCTVNGLPYDGQDKNKKQAKQLAARCAVERIVMEYEIQSMYDDDNHRFRMDVKVDMFQ